MCIKKTAISIALASLLHTGATQAVVIDMNFDGLFSMLDPAGTVHQNTSYPYYSDPTWGYGIRTQISGSLRFDTNTGKGSGTINPFEFFNAGPAVISGFEFQATGDGKGGSGSLMLGNMMFSWRGENITTQIVLDASGFFAELPTITTGAVYDASSCNISGACATPASDNIKKSRYPIGPIPITTSSFNTTGQTGTTTTLGQLSLGTDDGIGGSPMDNGSYSLHNANFDITSITIPPIPTPVPAAVWLFGSGLISLVGVARRRKNIKNDNRYS